MPANRSNYQQHTIGPSPARTILFAGMPILNFGFTFFPDKSSLKPTHPHVESSEFQQALRSCAARLTTQTNAALADLFDLTAQRLVRFAATVTGNQADAEDALQAVFSLLARHPRLLASASLPWPYLLRSIRNEALRLARRRGRTREIPADPASSGDSADPALQVAIEETGACVRRVLQSLPLEQLEVVVLKHWEDLTFAEIAESLNLSQNTVASRYRYAIEKLQRGLEPYAR